MQRKTLAWLSFISVLLLTACGGPVHSTPEDTAISFLKAGRNKDEAAMTACMARNDRGQAKTYIAGKLGNISNWELGTKVRDYEKCTIEVKVVETKDGKKDTSSLQLYMINEEGLWKVSFVKMMEEGNAPSSDAYEVTVAELRFADVEFNQGTDVGLQVKIFALNADGKRKPLIDTTSWGTNIGRAGDKEKPLVASWANKPVKIDWKMGEVFKIEAWDTKNDKILAEWSTSADAKSFPLSGCVTFVKVAGHDAKDSQGNFIKFNAKPTGAK
ncbi:MAG: hypothetical protein IT462_07945 [Planctomycetes bacterium]|nr:hypothetical protein [Planctomycetota bacterium]